MILMGLCNESGGLCPVNNISAELCMSVRLGLPITAGALRSAGHLKNVQPGTAAHIIYKS